MQFALTFVSAALLGVTIAAPQGVTEKLTPTGAAPAGCTGSFDGKFEITVSRLKEEKRSLPEKRAVCGSEGTLVMTLEDGTALDAQGRTGYIASNYQFQFDAPAQAGALYTSGFSICSGNVLALGSSKTFHQCLSGDFYNLYDRTWAEQCEPVSIIAIPCGSKDSGDEGSGVQIVGTTVVQTTIITALSDGQPQVITTTVPVPIYSTYVPVSEYTDGQIQVTPTGSAPPPPPPTTTAAPPPPPPPESTPVSTPEVTLPSTSVPISTAYPSSSSSAEIPTITTPVSSPSASSSSSPAPPATTSAPPTSGSSHVAAGSMGALIVGMLVAFFCL
ncbi:putative covalently-linked cell wall protein [Rosellinia necatrix]|uniref:Putative covalently-linked cell wall protein n=1 Tax=Rosellinia necatrix TaxID=77044 RepID=A0A1W2TFD5_ROSNE|nr:putative covalently-linked cell wall protein [Rosellinia necatrix]